MRDGLYRYTSRRISAGFVMREGKVVASAPILRRALRENPWPILVQAIYLGPDPLKVNGPAPGCKRRARS